ncbi:MAG: MFS transporter [Acidiferrobacterales bacterium]
MRADVIFPTLAMMAVLTVASMSSHSVAVLAPKAAPAIGVGAAYIGLYISIVYTSAMFSGAVTGVFVGRYGGIRVCQFLVLASAAAMGAFALAALPAVILSAVLLGMAHGPFNPASAHVLVKVSTPEWRPLIFSVKQSGVPVGGALAGALTPALVLLVGWQGAALTVSVLALVVLFLLQPLRERLDADRDPRHSLRGVSIAAPLKLVFTQPNLRPLALVTFVYAGCQLSVSGFFVVYLTQAVGMPLLQAGFVFALLQVAGICGRVLLGALAGRLVPARRLLAILGVSIAITSAMTAAITAQWPLIVIILVAIVLGASCLGWNGISLSEIAARAPEGKISEATGGVQFVMFAGIVLVPPSFGAVVNFTANYAVAFLLLVALAMIAGIYLMGAPRPVRAERVSAKVERVREVDTPE